jgi:hypothetical protein
MTGDELGKALKLMLDGNLDNYRSIRGFYGYPRVFSGSLRGKRVMCSRPR